MEITFENKEEILQQLHKKQVVKFAIRCARLVSNLNTHSAVEAAIVATENWVKNPSISNSIAAYDAGVVAYAAAATLILDAARAADAASAADAARAADAAAAAADAAYADNAKLIAYAATLAADAASSAASLNDDLKKEDIEQEIVQYLKELYLENLPEEERNSWLVQVAIGL